MAAALARGLARAERLGPASWVTLARATLAVGVAALVADSFAHDTPVALLVTLAAVALALDLVDGWLARRTGTAIRAGRALRRRGRRVPDPRPQRLRRPRVRRVGARDRGGALPVRRRRVAAAVDARAAAAAPLAQGRRGDAGDRADGRGRRRPAPRAHAGAPRRRARRARGVGRRVRVVAVAPPDDTRARRRAAGPSAGRCARACRGAHGARPAARLGRRSSRRTSRASSRSARSCGCRSSSSSSSRWRCCCPPPRAACWPWSRERCWRVLVVVKVLDMGFITAFDRPFDPVSDSSYVGIGIETLRDAIGRSSANLAVAAIVVLFVGLLALPVLALLRVTRVAAGHRGWALRAAAVLGVVWVALRVARRAGRLHERRRPRRRRGAGGPERACGSRDPRPRDPPRPLPRHSRRPAADRPARQGRPARCSSRATGGSRCRARPSRPGSTPCSTRAPRSCGPRGFSSRSAFLTSSTFGGLSWLAHSTLQSGIRIGTQRGYNQLVKSDRLTLSAGVQARRVAGGRRRTRRTSGRGRRARASTTTTRSTTAATSATAARASACRRCPTSTSCEALQRPRARQAPPASAVRRGRPHLEPRAVDAHPAAHPLGRRRRRLDLPPRPGGGVHAGRALRRRQAGPRRLRPSRSSTR